MGGGNGKGRKVRGGGERGISRRTKTLAAQLSRKINWEGRMEYQAIIEEEKREERGFKE